MRLKIRSSHLTCKIANEYLNICERVEVADRNKAWSRPFPCCLVNRQCLWKNPDRKNKKMWLLLQNASVHRKNLCISSPVIITVESNLVTVKLNNPDASVSLITYGLWSNTLWDFVLTNLISTSGSNCHFLPICWFLFKVDFCGMALQAWRSSGIFSYSVANFPAGIHLIKPIKIMLEKLFRFVLTLLF